LLEFRAMHYWTFSWPVILLAAAVVLVIGLLIAWGVRTLERQNRSESSAEQIQQAVGTAMAREPSLVSASILPVASFPTGGPPILELTGYVASAEARAQAVRTAQRELARLRPGMTVIDRLDVLPSLADRRARRA
jgi:hypothetical protein